jgi:hypothetical protein
MMSVDVVGVDGRQRLAAPRTGVRAPAHSTQHTALHAHTRGATTPTHAPRTCTPSISASSCATTRSITPPLSPLAPRAGASESSSSKNMTHGRARRARANASRTCWWVWRGGGGVGGRWGRVSHGCMGHGSQQGSLRKHLYAPVVATRPEQPQPHPRTHSATCSATPTATHTPTHTQPHTHAPGARSRPRTC